MVSDQPLDWRLDWHNHSPTGLDWGHGGSGAAQLALAILADFFGPSFRSLVCARHQKFKLDIVANFPLEGWELSGERIEKWLTEQESGSLQKSIRF
ncbi:MAG: DUF6166 domain-containing protein [Deltaproteobacteria bacterium]|nr:DUF6166 domain-containing protein [Deltaproteobacteria bacterium]